MILKKSVINGKNSTNIEYINIYCLFGRSDIQIPFGKVANIYIGENGIGKTTVLNCIYFLLEKKFVRLAEINFNSIEIKFQNEAKSHNISIYDLNEYNKKASSMRIEFAKNEVIQYLLEEMFIEHDINSFIRKNVFWEEEVERMSRRISLTLAIPRSVARKIVWEYVETKRFIRMNGKKKGDREKVNRLVAAINKNITQKIWYLPTYRRIEDDYSKLNITTEKSRESDMLIRFGMSDVQNSKNWILECIRQEAIEGFNKMTGVLLKQYTNDTYQDKVQSCRRNIDIETVQLILDRIGDKIDDESKTEIISLIKNKTIYNGHYSLLIDLLEKLIGSYELQKKYDDTIKLFADTCNKYLNGKKFYYNPSALTLEIYITEDEKLTSNIVELTHLSSGEKQIVSLFSKLYLENEKETIVIIDEPELSLSIKWQEMLLPDIVRSGNCKLLLTVTHSPFIFNNEFDEDACEMRKYIKYIAGE